MVEKFNDIEGAVKAVLAMHEYIPRDKLSPNAIENYEIMARAAPISGEIVRFLLSEQNRGTDMSKMIYALLELLSTNLTNMLVEGAESVAGDDYPDDPRHSTVHKIVGQISDFMHRNLGAEDDPHVIRGDLVMFSKKEVGDA
jgi:hypothetical protein